MCPHCNSIGLELLFIYKKDGGEGIFCSCRDCKAHVNFDLPLSNDINLTDEVNETNNKSYSPPKYTG